MDFTRTTYKDLLIALQSKGYAFKTFEDFLKNPLQRTVVLRHDVDKLPENALKIAQLENKLGVRSSYYFRVVPGVWDEAVMGQIVRLGHELGYHYEDLAIARGNHEKAIRHFEAQLERMRRIYPVSTICMHGSPLSRYDNRDLWKHYDYGDYGIIGEPYFDVNFDDVFYITDTGRQWNNDGASFRDRVTSCFNIPVKSTFHLIRLAEQDALPDKIMITVHPQRWHDRLWPWVIELVGQKVKNGVKRAVVGWRMSVGG